MIPTTDLFLLIKSMGKNEKRYFKLQIKNQGNRNYIQLFDTIDKQKQYDELKIKKVFSDKAFIKQLSVAKNYLYALILKVLSAYHSDRTVDFRIRTALNQVEILFFKNLFKQCLKIIEREKKIAEQLERYALLLELLKWERRIYSFDLNPGIIQLSRTITEKATQFKILTDYQILAIKFALLYKKAGKIRDSSESAVFNKLLKHPLLLKNPSTLGLDAQWHFWLSHKIGRAHV